MIQRVILGPLNQKWAKLPDINRREIVTLAPLMVPILLIGVYPKLILNYLTPTLTALLAKIGTMIP